MADTRLLPDAWQQDDQGGVVLLATRCGGCAALTFPPVTTCPVCWERHELRSEPLEQPGTVCAYSVVRVPAEGVRAPYAVAYVDFPGGVRLCGRLESWDDIAIGDPVVAVAGRLRSDLLGWFFSPVGADHV